MQGGAEVSLPEATAGGASASLAAVERDAAGGAGPGPAGGPAAAAAAAAAGSGAGQQQGKESLLAAAAKARKGRPAETEAEARLREEAEIMRNITTRMALKSVQENAQVGACPLWQQPCLPMSRLACMCGPAPHLHGSIVSLGCACLMECACPGQ